MQKLVKSTYNYLGALKLNASDPIVLNHLLNLNKTQNLKTWTTLWSTNSSSKIIDLN